ncbi:chromosome segregation protein SMC [Halobacteriales archaeon QS_1_68_17]|nr:MAG: chromosome segregation protein SMC [Halobacteriales archaeon QS_1_68_17]
MSSSQSEAAQLTVRAENVGGIDETEVALTPGVSILVGRNATNRTSFLQAIMAGLGSEQATVKGDADQGTVELAMGGETYTRELIKRNGSVVTRGEPFLEDADMSDLFAFLLESNEARRAVARGDDLRDLIMRPVDTDQIQADIERLQREKQRVDSEIEELDSLKGRLPELEERRTELEEKIERKRVELDEKETEIDEMDADVEETREEKAALEEKLEELRDERNALEQTRFKLETQQESLASLRDERNELERDEESLPEAPAGEMAEIEAEIDRVRERKQTLDSDINELQNVIQFNEEMLDGDGDEIVEALAPERRGDGAVTDKLLSEDGAVVCWTCGTEVERNAIESTLDSLKQLRRDKLDERRSLESDLDDLKQDRRELREKQREREQLERRLERIDEEIDSREGTIEELKAERERRSEEIDALEAEVRQLESEEYSDVLGLHREANQLEFELGRLESERDEVETKINDLEAELDRRDDLEDRREEIEAELEDLRTKIDQIEQEAVTQFNDHMDRILDILDYDNLDRIWIERRQREVREGRKKVTKSTFELHIVRSTDDGTTYEDTIEHLSESEREITGLVFALAGYLVHDVHETVPVMLLDSLEAIDSDRIAALVDYFEEYVDYLVVALLPEDAAALDESYHRVTEI